MFHKNQILQFLEASPESFWIVDMRSLEDYEKGHLSGAIHAPWGEKFKEVIEALPEDKMLLPYCEFGETSWGAATLVQQLGLKAMSLYDGAKTLEEKDMTKESSHLELNKIRELPKEVENILSKPFVMKLEEVSKKLENNDIILIDTREEEEPERVPGSITMKDFEKLDLDENNKPLVFMCYAGQSSTAKTILTLLKGHEAYSLEGGFGTEDRAPRGWKYQGYPVEKK